MDLKKLAAAAATVAALTTPAAAFAAGGPPADVPPAPAGTPAPETVSAPPATDPVVSDGSVAVAPPADRPTAESNPGTAVRDGALQRRPATPGPKASATAKRRAYGAACKAESKRPVKGQRGSAFSRCVNALARVAGNDASPRAACKGTSKKRVAGEKGTAFSRCVTAAAKLAEQLEEARTEPVTQTTEPATQA